jgi:hypothetical protein
MKVNGNKVNSTKVNGTVSGTKRNDTGFIPPGGSSGKVEVADA